MENKKDKNKVWLGDEARYPKPKRLKGIHKQVNTEVENRSTKPIKPLNTK